MLVTWRVVADDVPSAADRRVDYGGIAALSTGLFALLIALDLGSDRGWLDPWILGLFATTVLALVAFAFVERRASGHALVPGDVLENRTFVAACLATLFTSAIFFGALLFLPQFMSKILGFSAVAAGAGLLPLMIVFALTSFVAGPLYERLGPKLMVSAGAAFLTAGIFLLSQAYAATAYGDLVLGMVVLGVGVGLFSSSITTAAVTALDPSRTGLAGGIVYMCQVAGGSVGLGLNTALVVTAPTFAEGIRRAFLVDTGLGICGLIVAVLFVGGTVDPERLRTLRFHHRAHG